MEYHQLTGKEKGEVQIRCPLHNDSTPSASVNFQKGLFHCFVCGGLTLAQLDEKVKNEPIDEPDEIMVVEEEVDSGDLFEVAERFLEQRKILDELLGPDPPCNISVIDNPNDRLHGYLFFNNSESVSVGRALIPGKPKYLNESKKKSLFFLDGTGEGPVWLTEGIFDALSLRKCGIQNVAASLGAGTNEQCLFPLRGKTVFILFDNDWAGFKGARETYEKLLTLEANPIVVELPVGYKDVSEMLQNDEGELEKFLYKTLSQFNSNDSDYVSRILDATDSLLIFSTGLGGLDAALGGGYREGLHVVGAEPGIGKTAFCAHIALKAQERGLKVLINTCEVGKLEYWCRVASIFSKYTWEQLEFNPSMMEPHVFDKLQELSKNVKIVMGWELEKMLYASNDYDVVIVDYIQVIPSPINDTLTRVKNAIQKLALMATTNRKIVIAISSLNRSGYDDQGLSIFKESGDIEYSASTAIKVSDSFTNPNILIFDIRKNRKGVKQRKVDVMSNIAHCKFMDVDYELLRKIHESQQEEKDGI